MEQEIIKRLDEQTAKIDEIARSVEKLRKYFLVIVIITVAGIVLPLLGLVFAIPQFLNVYKDAGL